MAKKKVISEMRLQSKVCPEVLYTLMPLTNRLQFHVGAINIYTVGDESVHDHAQVGFDTVGFGLLAIEGIDDFELDFEKRKIGKKRTEKKVTDDCLEEIPTEILSEIIEHLNGSASVTKEEKKNLDFTSHSSPATTSPPAENAAETTANASSQPPAAAESIVGVK